MFDLLSISSILCFNQSYLYEYLKAKSVSSYKAFLLRNSYLSEMFLYRVGRDIGMPSGKLAVSIPVKTESGDIQEINSLGLRFFLTFLTSQVNQLA